MKRQTLDLMGLLQLSPRCETFRILEQKLAAAVGNAPAFFTLQHLEVAAVQDNENLFV